MNKKCSLCLYPGFLTWLVQTLYIMTGEKKLVTIGQGLPQHVSECLGNVNPQILDHFYDRDLCSSAQGWLPVAPSSHHQFQLAFYEVSLLSLEMEVTASGNCAF